MKRIFILLIFITPFFTVSCLPDSNLDEEIENDLASKYIGTWHVYEPDKKLNYDVTIVRYLNSNTEIMLNNFADLGNVKGLCVDNTIVIENQDVSSDYSVEGTGYYHSKNKLTFNYSLSDGIDLEDHTATFTR